MIYVNKFLTVVGAIYLGMMLLGTLDFATHYQYFGPSSAKIYLTDSVTCVVKDIKNKTRTVENGV